MVAHRLPNADHLYKVSIIPRGRTLGDTQPLAVQVRHTLPEGHLKDRLAVMRGRTHRGGGDARDHQLRRRRRHPPGGDACPGHGRSLLEREETLDLDQIEACLGPRPVPAPTVR